MDVGMDNLFDRTAGVVIGMVHFRPLLGTEGFAGIERVLDAAMSDVQALVDGGVDAVMLENNYDLPHKVTIAAETTACYAALAARLRPHVPCPLGLCVLWNDYKAALSIAHCVGADFVRIPAFVDTVDTAYGRVAGCAKEAAALRDSLPGKRIAILADVQVKHAQLVTQRPIEASATAAVEEGADALIVTGRWTADPPTAEDLRRVRGASSGRPVLVGSGASAENVGDLLVNAYGVIVGTSLKTGKNVSGDIEINVRSERERIDLSSVKTFVSAAHAATC